VTGQGPRGAIAFAEKVLELLDEGRYTATYKYAVLLALLDLCLEGTQKSGKPPQMVTTRQVADKIVELYWPHTVPFAGGAEPCVLRQNAGNQASILSAILRFRQRHAADPTVPRWESRRQSPHAYERMVWEVEWTLIHMPLPRLQTMGPARPPFIYEIGWDEHVQQGQVTRYQRGQPSSFDNRVMLRPGVGDYLVQLNGLLRPLIQRRWAAMVALLNHLEESRLEVFLFGADRLRTAAIRARLWEAQGRRCFYCDDRLVDPSSGEVDHFIPWSRYPDDTLDNFVVADRRCNGDKSSALAAGQHVARWAARFSKGSSEHAALEDLAGRGIWVRECGRTLGVARGLYLPLPEDARLWLRGHEFVAPDAATIAGALDAGRC
jgi:5-methylcytosine-specific restriction endonuclease McrA